MEEEGERATADGCGIEGQGVAGVFPLTALRS